MKKNNKTHKFNFLKILVPFFLFFVMIIFKSDIYALEVKNNNEEIKQELAKKNEIISKIHTETDRNKKNIKSTDDVDYNFFKKKILDVTDKELSDSIIINFINPIRDPNNPDGPLMLKNAEDILKEIYQSVFQNRDYLVKMFFNF